MCQAHQNSNSYLTLIQSPAGPQLEGQWDIALRDLQHALGLDLNGDGTITWGELRARQDATVNYALGHLTIEALARGERATCTSHLRELLVDRHSDGGYAVIRFEADCPLRPAELALHYRLLFDLDPNHRALVEARTAGVSQALTLSSAAPDAVIHLDAPERAQQFVGFAAEGVWHIWKGYDHILFLLTLLLPAVVRYREGHWQASRSLRDSLLDVLKIVTAFTAAHSLTLTLAVNHLATLPARWVEAAIALTVLLGALNNLYPIVRKRLWIVALLFGLIHGMEFASVLADLGLHGIDLALALVGFNAGVEAGQLVIVLAFVPLAFALRHTRLYRQTFMPWAAALIGSVAAYWLAIRIAGNALP
ncbi:MAG: HupE/UreJ family protein [Sinobacteraceae bacterium]|nr:HupE/UreJ family protein [Nevskiaceae bacterium]